MIILYVYSDGSQSVLFEKGDKVIASRNIHYGIFHNMIPAGTKGIVHKLTVTYDKLPETNIHPYYVIFNGFGTERVMPFEITHDLEN